MKRWLKWNSKSLLLISLTYKSKGEYGIRLEATQLTCILEPRHSTHPFTVIIGAFKGALSRQSGSFCLILPINRPQLLWNLKWAKKLHINDKIRHLRQTIIYVSWALYLKLQAGGINFEKLLGRTVFKNPNFNPFQSFSVLPIRGICCFCYVILTFL